MEGKTNRELQALQRKRRGEGSGVDVAGASGGAAGSAAAGAEAPPAPVLSAQDHQRALEESALQHVHANVPGPRVACRPTWPHFLSSSVIRQQMPAAISTSSYVEELREVESTAARSMETARRAAEQQEQEQQRQEQRKGKRAAWHEGMGRTESNGEQSGRWMTATSGSNSGSGTKVAPMPPTLALPGTLTLSCASW